MYPMHEMSIAEQIVRIAKDEMQKYPEDFCTAVHVKIGILRSVIPESLTFAFQTITESTCFNLTDLVIEFVPVLIECNDCKNTFTLQEIEFSCPGCGSTNISIVQGNELHVNYLEVEHGHSDCREKNS